MRCFRLASVKRFVLCALLLSGCKSLSPKPLLFPPEPKVWSLVPRDATLVAAMNVQATLAIIDGVLHSSSWDGTMKIRSVAELRARFKRALGIDPGLLTKGVLVLQLTSSNVYGGFLLYGLPRSVVPSKRVASHLGQPIYRLKYMHLALISGAIVLGDLRFVKRVLDLRYGVASSKTVASALWMHHADEIPSKLIEHHAFVADLKLLAERFALLRPFKLNYGAGAIHVNRGGTIVLDTEQPHHNLKPAVERLRNALSLLKGGLTLAVRLRRTLPLGGRLELSTEDLRRLLVTLHRVTVARRGDTIRISIKGSLLPITPIVVKILVASLKLYERYYRPGH